MLKRQLVHQSQRRATKNRGVATRLQSAAPAQFVRLLVACSVCTHTSGDDGMRKASTWMLEKGIQTLSPSPDHIPAQNHKLLLRTYIETGTSNGGTSDRLPFTYGPVGEVAKRQTWGNDGLLKRE